MEKIIVDAVSGIDRLGEVLDSIAALSSEADGIKKQLKEDAELFGDCVAFNGASYTATVTARRHSKTDWRLLAQDYGVPEAVVTRYTKVSKMLVCSVIKIEKALP